MRTRLGRTTTKTRIFTLLLALVMVLGLIPGAAYARVEETKTGVYDIDGDVPVAPPEDGGEEEEEPSVPILRGVGDHFTVEFYFGEDLYD